jgi:hypothetical protein
LNHPGELWSKHFFTNTEPKFDRGMPRLTDASRA